jgi:hypothetical protein
MTAIKTQPQIAHDVVEAGKPSTYTIVTVVAKASVGVERIVVLKDGLYMTGTELPETFGFTYRDTVRDMIGVMDPRGIIETDRLYETVAKKKYRGEV